MIFMIALTLDYPATCRLKIAQKTSQTSNLGSKDSVEKKDISILSKPRYEELNLLTMLTEVKNHEIIVKCLPDLKS